MQRLFSVPKVGLFLDAVKYASEKRRDDTVKIMKASFRLQPFDAKLATAIDDGLSDNSGVRAALFKLSSVEPKPHIERLNFSLSCPRQNMEIFATPDTDESRVMLLQVKIGGVYARTQKDLDGYAFCFDASFGPLDRATLEFMLLWFQGQMFVNFTEAEPSLEFSDEVPEDEDDEPFATRPTPMFDDEPELSEPSAGVAAAKASTTERKRDKGHHYPKRKAKKPVKKGRR
jgi:hypothetical protein